jgi:hypothetical protein|tara:strand:+ start:465 stop:743 length:279 start_codon:yes stop_codon:yes gene_type:complete
MAQVNKTYNRAAAITKSDTVNFDGSTYSANPTTQAIAAEAVYCGGAGVVAAIFPSGNVENFTVTAGQTLPLHLIRVNSTNTTASLMVALYED